MERWATAAILSLALALRLLGLGTQPLQPAEAANAWQSWSLFRGAGGSASAGPLLIYGNALVFLLFGASDATARLLPALAGTAMVALPLLLERELGRVGSRAAMLLLAISPTLVHYSRQADASILAAGATLALVAFGAAAYRGASRRAAYAAAASAALLLVAGPLACYAVVALVGYALLRSVAGRTRRPAPASRAGFVAPLGPDFAGADVVPAVLRDRTTLVRAGLVVGATWLVATTGLLTNLHGVQEGLADGLDAWLRSLVTPTGQSPLLYAAILVGYELPALAFGVMGAGYFAGRASGLAGLLTWWALAVFALGSVGAARPAGLAPLLVVPLALLAGGFAGDLARDLRERRFRVDLGWLALGGTIVLAGLGIALDHLSLPDPLVPDYVLALPVALVGVGLAAAVRHYGGGRALRLLLVFGFGVLLALSWRAGALLNQQGAANPADLFAGSATSADVRSLAADTSDVVDALAMDGQFRDVVVAPVIKQPVRWYLRDLPGVTVGDAGGTPPAIAVVPAETRPLRGSYAGQRYRVLSVGRLELRNWREAWRWLAYRESPVAPLGVDAVVYVRSVPSR